MVYLRYYDGFIQLVDNDGSSAFHTELLDIPQGLMAYIGPYGVIFGYKSLIFNENLNLRSDDFKYPQDQDKKITDAIIQGQLNEAKKALSDIIHNASQYSFTILNSVLIRLLLSIRHAIEALEANHSITQIK